VSMVSSNLTMLETQFIACSDLCFVGSRRCISFPSSEDCIQLGCMISG
jgi:hypothetical protein